jgi:hypothetical protein
MELSLGPACGNQRKFLTTYCTSRAHLQAADSQLRHWGRSEQCSFDINHSDLHS